MSDTRAIILAAGRGSRLGVLTKDTPKSLLSIGESNFLENQIKIYKKLGISEVSVVTGYSSDSFKNYTELEKIPNHNWFETNMLTSLLIGHNFDKSKTDVISYGDLIFEDIAISTIIKSPYDISVLYDINFLTYWQKRSKNPLLDLEDFRINSKGQISKIGTKPNSLDEIEGQYMGILKITPNGWNLIFEFIESEKIQILNTMSLTGFLNKFIKLGGPVYGIPYNGKWCEIDTLADLELARKIFHS
jgi:choline kinase